MKQLVRAVTAIACIAVLALPLTASAAVAPFAEAFDGGQVGARPTSANTAYDQSIGDRGVGDGSIGAVFDASGRSGHSARFYNTSIAKGSFGFLGERVGTQRTIYFRRYYMLGALPSYRMSILLYKYGGSGNGQLGGTHNGSFAIGGSAQSHHFTLVNNNTNSTQSRSAAPVGSWFRVEVKLAFASTGGTQTVRLFLGSNRNGTTPDQTLTASVTGTYTDYVEDGILTNPNTKTSVYVDQAVNASSWPGPLS